MLTKGKRCVNITELSAMRRWKILGRQLEETWKSSGKKLKKGIDKAELIWYNIQAVARDGAEKRVWKNLKKYLTNARECDILNKLSRKWQRKAKAPCKLNNTQDKQNPEILRVLNTLNSVNPELVNKRPAKSRQLELKALIRFYAERLKIPYN